MANPDCEKVLNLIPLYIDNMLSEEENDIVSRHLNSCENCKKEFEFMTSLVKSVADIPEISPPSDFHKKLMAKAEKIARNKKARRYIMLRRVGTGMVAAAVLALSIVSFANIKNQNSDVNPDNIYQHIDISDAPISLEAEKNAQPTDTNKDLPSTPKAQPTPLADEENAVPDKDINVADENLLAVADIQDEEESYTVVTVTADDSTLDELMQLLSGYEKDEKGYKVDDIKNIISELKNIDATITIEKSETMTSNYIIIK